MSPEEALAQLQARQAAAATQASADEVASLKETVAAVRERNTALQKQIGEFRRLIPESPQKGWNFSTRVLGTTYNRVLETGLVYDIAADGTLHQGNVGQRVMNTVETRSMPYILNGQTIQDVSYQHFKEPQVALYNVFCSNGSPFDPSLDAEQNIKRMVDAYLVLVNVDTNSVEFANRNDEVWADIFVHKPKEETTIVMQQMIIIHTVSN
jgi:hypothetical protein